MRQKLLLVFLYFEFSILLTTGEQSSNGVDIKIGFLVSSKRWQHDQTSSLQGDQLVEAFNYGLYRINQNYHQSQLRFHPIVAETFANETESVKQTVELINKHKVNFIVGPQETCQMESRIASVFNVAMISHYCPQWIRLQTETSTFIQTKPPNWKIVQRVVTLVDQLLEARHSRYPQQLVLLYFKETPVSNESQTNPRTQPGGHSSSAHWQDTYLASDAVQYRLVGELLEIKLNELFVARSRRQTSQGTQLRRPLTVLNWHTTFHYGYMENPFRELLSRHLFHRTFVNQYQCSASSNEPQTTTAPPTASTTKPAALDERAAIYIVVGHYYEHLGLMLALNKLNLLARHQRPQSSVPANQRGSVVIGVDFEQYDERDDSVRFMRGLLMDESEDGSEHRSANLDMGSIANMYRRYIGVVPANPTKMTDFLEGIHSLRTNQHQHAAVHQGDLKSPLTLAPNQTLDKALIKARLLQFVRLPVEAFYLYDSLMLLGSYFNDCLRHLNLTLDECSSGRRAFRWFQNRKFTSFLYDNMTSFDSQAQIDGSYNLIGRRLKLEDEFGLVSVGQFVNSDSDDSKMDFHVNPNEIDLFWLPLWCHVKKSNHSHCFNLTSHQYSTTNSDQWLPLLLVISIPILLVLVVGFIWKYSTVHKNFTNNNCSNAWFNETDERNFLNIVHHLLMTPEILDDRNRQLDELGEHRKPISTVDLHCHMFAFPSCKFVHWLTALHQLKEMMFQYQSGSTNNTRPSSWECSLLETVRKLLMLESTQELTYGSRGFFALKHKGTPSLRLLLNKYKCINGCFCNLSELDHKAVVKLHGVTLSFRLGFGENKIARLLVEEPDRGNLRDAFKFLSEILDQNEVNGFKSTVVSSMIGDLLDGLEYLHRSRIEFHGELRATTCLLTTDWRLKLSGFHANHMRRSLGQYEQKNVLDNDSYMDELIYSAPEVLDNHNRRSTLSKVTLKLADIYSFAFVIYELLVWQEPWACLTNITSSKLLVERVRVDSGFRPPLERLDKELTSMEADSDVIRRVIRSCWSASPDRRPQSVGTLRARLELCARLRSAGSGGLVRKLYAELLERVSLERKLNLSLEVEKNRELKMKLFPVYIANKLRQRAPVLRQHHESVSFCLFKLILVAKDQSPFDSMNEIMAQIDALVDSYHHHIHMVDSQVDSSLRYMIYSGAPLKRKLTYNHCQLVASFALQLIDLINRCQNKLNSCIQVKCALHCGPVLGGILNGPKDESSSPRLARYVLFGPALQTVDTLETTSLPQRIQISADLRSELIQSSLLPLKLEDATSQQGYVIIKREAKISARIAGGLETYWLLNGPRLSASQSFALSAD